MLGVIMGAAGVVLAYSVLVEPYWVRFVEYTVAVAGLPRGFEGMSILHLSDFHGRVEVFSLPKFRHWVKSSDLIAITGDLYALTLPRTRLARALDTLHAPLGVYYVSGNHDYRHGRLATAPWNPGPRLLDNDVRSITRDNQRIWIAGLPDLVKGRPELERVASFLHGTEEPAILLSHRPDARLLPEADRFQLVLSGHTHGGQVTIPGIGAPVRHNHIPGRYAAGYYCRETGPVLITSRGLGTSELPIRFNARPEVVRIRLTAGPENT